MQKLLLLLSLFVVFCHSNSEQPKTNKVLVNGDFEKDLSIGWLQKTRNVNISDEINREIKLDGDQDFELIIEKTSDGQIKLYQVVEITNTNLQFSVTAKMQATEQNPEATDYWAAGVISLQYLNGDNSVLGETKITAMSPHCPWIDSKNLHIISAVDETGWHKYDFNLNDELENLAGVKPNDVKKIQFSIIAVSNGC
jgi:hypothetical protein